MEKKWILEFQNISKSFVGVKALTKVSFRVEEGEVHALLGENGAGKSTLMKILSGAYTRDEGTILLDGKEIQIKNTKESERLGISIIYQELNLIPELSVAENIYLDRQPKKKGRIDWKGMNEAAQKMLESIDMMMDPKVKVSSLSVAQRQMVEIAKAVSLNARLVIMDEPTSALTEGETKKLFQVIESLKKKGITIIYISQRMDEIFKICDSYTILRDGQFISSGSLHDVTIDQIIEDMVGRPLMQVFPEKNNKIGEVILEVRDMNNGKEVKGVSFTLRKGEILGFAGLVGAGRSETLKAVFGADRRAKGEIILNGKKINIRSPKDAIRYGIGFLPEDRKKEGLVVGLSVLDNVVMAKTENAMTKGIFSAKKAKEICTRYIKDLLIKTPSEYQAAKFLSGGNQQKVVLAKWLNSEPQIIVLDEPTRGIDVNAKMEIYNIIVKLAEEGKSIILISSEMQEIIGLCDHVNVMFEGRISGELNREELSQEGIMKFATGGSLE
ncbi:MAG: sugar ABC transporter ATP-binding protein [Faecalicatena sp.]|uniref:sugar ABC transporter ATP-binding protein n=1 Tax=Faecalicatena sp. TaxID=2005360 RepID=UPI0025848CF5|nr:sugar ABC transporter ATP-binding protein [Faecalicatena sp.]MCI6466968.1 sugar ABC transporter ATP-binding protein [Faecalicatena sp.]MDY5617676.1 sugar ABC transporter ATP-binding protein [Lachnospiraceae bacterium]